MTTFISSSIVSLRLFAVLVVIVVSWTRHEGVASLLTLFRHTTADLEVGQDLRSLRDTADDFGHYTVGGSDLYLMCLEGVILECPQLMFALTVADGLSLLQEGLSRNEAQRLGRY